MNDTDAIHLRMRSNLTSTKSDMSQKGAIAMHVTCPECGNEFEIPDDTMVGEIVVCSECGAELEVVSLDPPELALAPEVEEDWGE
jgi:alpha-aminoadipate carrier protein LysW